MLVQNTKHYVDQIVVVKDGDVEYLHYTEDLCTKTNQGGLDHQQVPPKEVVVYPGPDPSRCLVALYKKYIEMLPKTLAYSQLYLQANTAKCIKAGGLWFKDKAIGINTLAKTMKTMAKEAKIESFLTNHSLRASCATVLHNDECNLPEQVIAECTGH